jgi:hypothetical protein
MEGKSNDQNSSKPINPINKWKENLHKVQNKEKNVFCKELREQPQQQQGGWKTHGWKHMPHTDPLHLRVYVCLQLPPVMASSVLQPAPSAITQVAQLISVQNCIGDGSPDKKAYMGATKIQMNMG